MLPENPRFTLAQALRRWNDDLAAEPGLTPETRHELEIHLRDTMAELRKTGLDED